MSDPFAEPQALVIDAMANAARGPKRNGLFALWLFLRLAEDRLPPQALSERAHRRRLESFERRLSSLSVPAPLKRALTGSLRELGDGPEDAVAVALHHLIAPARETIGAPAAAAIDHATEIARGAVERVQLAGAET